MTEAEWLTCQDHLDLFKLLHSRSDLRKWQLASLACAQLLPVELRGAEIPVALTLVENIVEGSATFSEAEAFLQRIAPDGRQYNYEGKSLLSWGVHHAWDIVDWVRPTHANPLDACLSGFIDIVGSVAGAVADPDHFDAKVRHTMPRDIQNAHRAVSAQVCPILRDIFGNPFCPVAFSPEWRTDTAGALAAQMYESRDFSPMPILADALQDAGCDNDDVLNHCRDPHAPHVRGCWVVDLVLGKE